MDPRARQLTPTRRRALRTPVASVLAVALASAVATPASAQDAVSVSDSDSTRTILLVVAGLVTMGVVLSVVTVWFWRSTRPDHPALAPLEVMGDRRFPTRSAFEQRQLLDSVRPEGAEVQRAAPVDDALADRGGAALDLQRLVVDTPTSFDDLIEPAPAPPTPVEPVEQVEPDGEQVEPVEPVVSTSTEMPPPPPVPADR